MNSVANRVQKKRSTTTVARPADETTVSVFQLLFIGILLIVFQTIISSAPEASDARRSPSWVSTHLSATTVNILE